MSDDWRPGPLWQPGDLATWRPTPNAPQEVVVLAAWPRATPAMVLVWKMGRGNLVTHEAAIYEARPSDLTHVLAGKKEKP